MEPNMYKQTCTCAVLAYRTVKSTMSSSTPGRSSAPYFDFKSILDAALRDYKNTTGKSLLDDPLADKVQQCDSVDTLKAIFQDQAKALQSKDGDKRSMKWIDPTVDVLSKISDTLGGVAGIVRH